jgi:hypothetical protein
VKRARQSVLSMSGALTPDILAVKYWVMFNFTAWSIVTACTAIAHNFTGLLICRILLGMFEA